MNRLDKSILLLIATIAGVFVPLLVVMFGMAVGDEFDFRDALLVFIASLVISSPVWISLIIPARYKFLSIFFRWLGAITLLLPVYFYFSGEISSKATQFLLAGKFRDFLFHIPFIVIILLCVFGSWLLVKSDIVKSTQ